MPNEIQNPNAKLVKQSLTAQRSTHKNIKPETHGI